MDKERRNLIKVLCASPLIYGLGPTGCGGSSNTNTVTPPPVTPPPVGTNWASGGTDLITVPFPDDSIFDTGNTCTVSLNNATTEGPCYFEDDTGEDLSLGFTGLPMQLCLRLVDSSCQPLSGFTIEVWHCDIRGIYSGDISNSNDAARFSNSFCTNGDSAAQTSTWYRGMLTTDANGRVNFKTCFPGWYPGRTIHFHFAVNDATGNSRVISQLCFTDSFANEICTGHPQYSGRGQQDTPIANDGVFNSNVEEYLLTARQNSDNTLLAYHTIQIN